MTRMKALARQYFWWPNLDNEIETYVKSCDACMSNSKTPNSFNLLFGLQTTTLLLRMFQLLRSQCYFFIKIKIEM